MTTFMKDPTAILDYAVDWSAWLSGDTIATSTWTVPTGLTLVRLDFTPSQGVAWISGGTVGQTYFLTNTITTAAGREDSRMITVLVENR